MSLYTGKIIHSYEWRQLSIYNYSIEQVKKFYSYEKFPLGKDKYPISEWAPGIPILDHIQEEGPYIINEDELDVEDVAINNDDNGQEEYEDEQDLNIIE